MIIRKDNAFKDILTIKLNGYVGKVWTGNATDKEKLLCTEVFEIFPLNSN